MLLYMNSVKCVANRPLCCNPLLMRVLKKLCLVIDLSRYVSKLED